MKRRLGVLLACLALTACSPGSEGEVLVGRDEQGRVVAVLGICTTDRMVSLDVDGPQDTAGPEYDDSMFERARKFVSGDVGRIVLQRPPDHGTVTVGVRVHVRRIRLSNGEGTDHHMKPAELDLANVPHLPPDADEVARSFC